MKPSELVIEEMNRIGRFRTKIFDKLLITKEQHKKELEIVREDYKDAVKEIECLRKRINRLKEQKK